MEAGQTQIEKGWGFCLRKTRLGGGLEQGPGRGDIRSLGGGEARRYRGAGSREELGGFQMKRSSC